MATVSVTNTFVNGLLADADDVNLNFTDLVSFINASVVHVDGSKSFTAPVTGVAPTSDLHLATRKFADTFVVTFTQSGDQVVGAGTTRWYPPEGMNCEVVGASANVSGAPTGADLQVDVNRDGTTIFTTQTLRPIIAATGFVDASGTPDGTATLTALTNYLTVDVDQIGSTLPGTDLVVNVHLRRT